VLEQQTESGKLTVGVCWRHLVCTDAFFGGTLSGPVGHLVQFIAGVSETAKFIQKHVIGALIDAWELMPGKSSSQTGGRRGLA